MTKCWNIHIFKLASNRLFFLTPLWLASRTVRSNTFVLKNANTVQGNFWNGGARFSSACNKSQNLL